MTEADPDAIGLDGRVRLRCYPPLANSLWFSVGCQGRQGCGHSASISVHAAIRLLGSGEATVGELERRLRCSGCGNREVSVTVRPDTRPHEARERDGPGPAGRGGITYSGAALLSLSRLRRRAFLRRRGGSHGGGRVARAYAGRRHSIPQRRKHIYVWLRPRVHGCYGAVFCRRDGCRPVVDG